jgi:hypothetical protein
MRSQCMKGIAVSAALVMASCMNNPSNVHKGSVGNLEIRASLAKPQNQSVLAKSTRTMATTWDSCVVKISASDMDTIDTAFKFSPQDASIIIALDNVPAGKQRSIEVFTKTKANLVVHVSSNQVVDISAAEKKVLNFRLVPVLGSIYIDLTNIPTSVKRVCAEFDGDTICDDRATKLFLSIDNVPDKTSDSLIIIGTDSTGAVIYHSSLWLAFSAIVDTTLATIFGRVSTSVSMTMSAQVPATTVVSGFVGSTRTIAYETGRLLISEIMYAANDSEYVEVYNPSGSTYADSLILEIDGQFRSLGTVSIPAKGFFVIGRKSLPWSDAYPSVSTALDLSSGGNWLSLRSKANGDTVMDWVAFTGSSNSQEWPNPGTAPKKSIVVDSVCTDPLYNNYGRNWTIAQTLISASYPSVSTTQYGTPKSQGF